MPLGDLLPAAFAAPDLSARRRMPDAVSLIQLKRDNVRPLTEAEIGWLFAAYAAGEVADEQMAALLMAIYFNGLTPPSCGPGPGR